MSSISFTPVALTFETLDVLAKQDRAGELIGLYTCYAHVALWQKTSNTRATVTYMCKKTGWSEPKVKQLRKKLIDLDLIRDVVRRDEKGTITGHYVQVRHLVEKDILENIDSTGVKSQGVDKVEHIQITNNLDTNNGHDPNNTEEFETFFKQPKEKKSKLPRPKPKVKAGYHVLAQAKDICNMFTEARGGQYYNSLNLNDLVPLLENHGIDEVKRLAEHWLARKKVEFEPEVNKPVDLADHWGKLVELMEAPKPKKGRY